MRGEGEKAQGEQIMARVGTAVLGGNTGVRGSTAGAAPGQSGVREYGKAPAISEEDEARRSQWQRFADHLSQPGKLSLVKHAPIHFVGLDIESAREGESGRLRPTGVGPLRSSGPCVLRRTVPFCSSLIGIPASLNPHAN
jgi:hypothetical protein